MSNLPFKPSKNDEPKLSSPFDEISSEGETPTLAHDTFEEVVEQQTYTLPKAESPFTAPPVNTSAPSEAPAQPAQPAPPVLRRDRRRAETEDVSTPEFPSFPTSPQDAPEGSQSLPESLPSAPAQDDTKSVSAARDNALQVAEMLIEMLERAVAKTSFTYEKDDYNRSLTEIRNQAEKLSTTSLPSILAQNSIWVFEMQKLSDKLAKQQDSIAAETNETGEKASAAKNIPSVETIDFSQPVVTEEELEAEERRNKAIQRLPQSVKDAVSRLYELLLDDSVSEITINGSQFVGFKRNGQRFVDPNITFPSTEVYHAIMNSFILPLTNTNDRIGSTEYLIESQLMLDDNSGKRPQIARVHMLVPPGRTEAYITIAKKSRDRKTLDMMTESGTMTRDMAELLKALVRGRSTIIFSGSSGSGKTTLLEAMSQYFDTSDRVALIEEIEELIIPVTDIVPMHAYQPKPGEDQNKAITLEWNVKQVNRIRPDRIVVGEIRGSEMGAFLQAANSGITGSMTTVHANSPQDAIRRMMNLVNSGNSKSEEAIYRDMAATIQVIVQLEAIDGRHIISQIEEVTSTVTSGAKGIQTQTLYRYDKMKDQFVFENRVSENFTNYLKQYGVDAPNPRQQQPLRRG